MLYLFLMPSVGMVQSGLSVSPAEIAVRKPYLKWCASPWMRSAPSWAVEPDIPASLLILSAIRLIPTVNPPDREMDLSLPAVSDALGGKPIRRWYKKWKPAKGKVPEGNGDLYDILMAKVNAAIKGQKIQSVTFIWMHGERDANEKQGKVYAESLKGLFNQLASDLKRKEISVVIGRINDFDMTNQKLAHWTIVREAQVEVAESLARTAWVNTDDLNGEKNDIHALGDGYKILGERFANKALKLLEK